jgi:hypothetical protein
MKVILALFRTMTLALLAVLSLASAVTCGAVEPTGRTDYASLMALDGSNLVAAGVETMVTAMSDEPLTAEEIAGILFMREEEKLARDVYLKLYEVWEDRAFDRIAESEKTHMDAIATLIKKYDLEDPVAEYELGVFQNARLQQLYDSLLAVGSASHVEALKVGALIEEIDIDDLQKQLDDVDNADVEFVYENLQRASRNHLRAFSRRLDSFDVTYEPQVLTKETFTGILSSGMERGPMGDRHFGRHMRRGMRGAGGMGAGRGRGRR